MYTVTIKIADQGTDTAYGGTSAMGHITLVAFALLSPSLYHAQSLGLLYFTVMTGVLLATLLAWFVSNEDKPDKGNIKWA